MVLSHFHQDNGGAAEGARGDHKCGTLATARLEPRADTPSVLAYTTSINSLLSEGKITLVSPGGTVMPSSRSRRSGLGASSFGTGRVRDGGDGKVGKQGGIDNNMTTNSTSTSTSSNSSGVEAAEQYGDGGGGSSCRMPFSCASSKGAVANLSESQGPSSFTSPRKDGRASYDGATSLRYPSTVQRKRSSENTTPAFDLVGTIFTVPQSPVSSMSSLHFSEESGGEGNFRSWLRRTRKTRNSSIFARGGKDGNAIVSKDLIALARARQEREAREESDSSSFSSSISESSNRDDGRRSRALRGPARSLALSTSWRALAVAPRVSFKTVGPAEGSLPLKSSQRLTVKTQSRDVRRSHLRADLVHGNDEQDNLKQGLGGGRGVLGVDVRKAEPERSNPDVSSTAGKPRRMIPAANHKCMSSVDETRDEEGKENEDVSILPSQTNISSLGGSSSANRPDDSIPVDAVSATKGMGKCPSVEASCVLADEDGAGAECTVSSVASAANRYSASPTVTSINQGAVAFDMAPARDKNTSPFDDTSNVFPSKEATASISTGKEAASSRLHHQATSLFDSTSDLPKLKSPTGNVDQSVVESKGQSTEYKAGTPGTTGGCFTPESTQLQSVATLTLDPSRSMSLVVLDSKLKSPDEVVSALEGRARFLTESVLEKVVGDSNGRELRKEEGTDHQPEAVSDGNNGSEEEGADQRHSKQKAEHERVAGRIETEGGKGEERPRIDEQPVFLDSNPKYSDEVASASEGRALSSTESVLEKVVGGSNGRELRNEEGTDHQPEAVSDGSNGREEEGADQCHSKQKAEHEKVAGGIETEGEGDEEEPRIDEQPVFLDSNPNYPDEVASASEGRETVLGKVVGDSNGRELRNEEGTDHQPEVVSGGKNGSGEEGADQCHSKQKAEQERVAGGIETEGGGSEEEPRSDEQPVFLDSNPNYPDEVASASKGREPVLGNVAGDSNGGELRNEEGTDHQPEVGSGGNDGSEEEGADQCHSKQKAVQDRVAGGIETEGGKGEEGPPSDEQPIFLDSNPKYSDEVASASEGSESVPGKVVGDSNGREPMKDEGTDHQPEVVSGRNDGSEEEGADQCHSKQQKEHERFAGRIETEEGKGEEGPRIDKQPVFLDSNPKNLDEVVSASEGRAPFSTESVLGKVVGDSNGRELRKDEGTDHHPETVSDGSNGSEKEGADQRHSKQKAEQERVARGMATAEEKGAEGPRSDEQPPMVSSICSVYDEQNQREQPATDQTSFSRIEQASAKDGLSNQAGLLASFTDVSRQKEASPITTKGHDSQTPRVGESATAPDMCLPPELQRQTVTPPVPHDAPSSPAKPLDTNAGKDSSGTWGNEKDTMDAFRVDDIGLNDDRCGKRTRFLLPTQPEAPPKTQAQLPPPTTRNNGAMQIKDPWRARILAEAATVMVNRGDVRRSASVSRPELTSRSGDDTSCCDNSLRKDETASPDFGSAALMEIRASVVKDPWYTRILAEAAATLANGRGMQKPVALAPSNVTCGGDGYDVGCGHTRTAPEPVPMDSPTEPIASDDAFVRSPFSSRSKAGVADPNKLSYDGRWGSGGREPAQLVQPSTLITTRGPRTVRDSWSMRILAEAAATLAICGVVRRSVLLSTVETVPIDFPSVRGNRRCGCAATALSSDSGDSGSTTGGRSPRMSLPILRGRRSKRCGDRGSTPRGRSPRMSLPILRGRGGKRRVAETLPRWGCCVGLERFPGHPMIVDYGLLGCERSDSPRISSRRCTACTSDNGRESPQPSTTINNRTSFPGNPEHGHLRQSTSEGEHVRAPTPPARRAHSSDSVSACTPRSRIAKKLGLSAVARGGEDEVNLRLRGHVVFPAACWEGNGGHSGDDSNSTSGDCRRRIYLPKAQHRPSGTSGEVVPSINPRSNLKETRIVCSHGTDPILGQETRAPKRQADLR